MDALVPLPQEVVDDRVEKRLGLARARAGGDQDVLPRLDRLEDLLLVQPHRGVADQTGHDRVQQTPVGHGLDGLPLGKCLGERHEGSLDQGDVKRGLAPELLAGLRGEVRVGDRECGEDVPQKLVTDAMGKLDGVDGHNPFSDKCTLMGFYWTVVQTRRALHMHTSYRSEMGSERAVRPD